MILYLFYKITSFSQPLNDCIRHFKNNSFCFQMSETGMSTLLSTTEVQTYSRRSFLDYNSYRTFFLSRMYSTYCRARIVWSSARSCDNFRDNRIVLTLKLPDCNCSTKPNESQSSPLPVHTHYAILSIGLNAICISYSYGGLLILNFMKSLII